MSGPAIGALSLLAITILIAFRVHIGLALGGVAILGLFAHIGPTATMAIIKSTPFEFAASWELSAIPMFILMGNIAFYSGMTESLFKAARLWMGRLPGGLAVATNFASAGFAAASGSSLATTIAMGRLSIPEMRRYKYDVGLATSVVAAAGTLGSMIPPSILLVLYGIFAEQSISKLFLAAIIPGVMTAFIYGAMIMIRCSVNPSLAPVPDERPSWSERLKVLLEVWPLPLLIFGVIGSIYGGWATATEAAALGSVLALCIAILQRRLTFDNLRRSLFESVVSSSALFFIAMGAIMMTRLMAFTGFPIYLSGLLEAYAISPMALIILTGLLFLILGCFIDALGMILLTLPILLPLFRAQGIDLIWLGIFVVKFSEIGMMTPPLGLNVFAAKSLAPDVPLTTIFKGMTWFLACELLVVVILVAFPEIVYVLIPT
jgi:tripartite ATP-independent transporter DctM subunit